MPRSTAWAQIAAHVLLQLQSEALDSAGQGDVIALHAAVGQHAFEVAVADRDLQVPAHGPEDHIRREAEAAEGSGSSYGQRSWIGTEVRCFYLLTALCNRSRRIVLRRPRHVFSALPAPLIFPIHVTTGRSQARPGAEHQVEPGAHPATSLCVILLTVLRFQFWQCVLAECDLCSSFPKLAGCLGAPLFLVRPAWALTWRWKSSRELVTASEAIRRALDREDSVKEAGREAAGRRTETGYKARPGRASGPKTAKLS